MARKRKKIKTEDLDLLPVMNLFSILIPFLLSVAVFQKMAIVEVNMPSRSQMNMDNPAQTPDKQALNLTVAITASGLEIWARGGSLPKIFTKEMITYRCKSDNIPFRVDPAQFSDKNPVTCKNGELASKYEKEIIHVYGLEKTSENDPGKLMKAVYNGGDSVMVDSEGRFIQSLDSIKIGDVIGTLAEASGRTVDEELMAELKLDYLSGYDMLAKTLISIQNQSENLQDAEKIILLADDKIVFDKIINVMDVAREAGFWKIQLAKLGGS